MPCSTIPADVEFVLENAQRLARLYVFRFGVPIVDQNVVGLLQTVARVKDESAGNRIEALWINSVDHVEPIYGIELH